MPDIDLRVILWTLAGIIGVLVFVVPVIVGPMLVYATLRFRPTKPFVALYPDDPRLPSGVRWFFGEVWTQLQPIGFEPTVYLVQRGMLQNSVNYLAIFDHRANRDGAAAMVVVAETGNGQQCSSFVAEFSTESVDGMDVCTNNGGDPSGISTIARKKILKIPGMRDLAALYKCHRMHMEDAGLRSKKSLANPEQRASGLTESICREFEALVRARCLRRVSNEPAYQFRLVSATINTWKLVPGVSWLGRALIRRRARRWLKAHGMSQAYQVVNFKRMASNQLMPPNVLPIPDWYSGPISDDAIVLER